MTNYEVVTVATHKFGMFNGLINNEFNVPVKVLGMGEKWTGFKMKYELIYDYIKDLDDDLIIIYVDGFDSKINKHPDEAIKIFLDNDYKVLFSRNVRTILNIQNLVFPNCQGNIGANTGLYMGYVKYLKDLLENLLKYTCQDDQVILNKHCSDFDFISIDKDMVIFKNIYHLNDVYNDNVIFLQYPAGLNSKRVYRSFFEYGQFLLPQIIIAYIILCFLLFYFGKLKYTAILSILLIIYMFNIDTSCIDKRHNAQILCLIYIISMILFCLILQEPKRRPTLSV